eukprot:4875745-Pleurochrysis_carterae.AAC.2
MFLLQTHKLIGEGWGVRLLPPEIQVGWCSPRIRGMGQWSPMIRGMGSTDRAHGSGSKDRGPRFELEGSGSKDRGPRIGGTYEKIYRIEGLCVCGWSCSLALKVMEFCVVDECPMARANGTGFMLRYMNTFLRKWRYRLTFMSSTRPTNADITLDVYLTPFAFETSHPRGWSSRLLLMTA